MTSSNDADATELWRSSVTLALVVLVTAGLGAIAYAGKAHVTVWQSLQAAVVASVVVAVLGRQRMRPDRIASQVAFAAIIASSLVMVTTNQYQLARADAPFYPLGGHKLLLLALAVLAPRLWLGVVSLLVVALAAMITLVMFPAALSRVAGEPIVTLLCACVALALLMYRARTRATERALTVARAEAAAAQKIASTFLAVRDLANTPLQTLMLSVDLLEFEGNGADPGIARIKRAVAQLERLNDLLASEEANLETERPNLEAFDAKTTIKSATTST